MSGSFPPRHAPGRMLPCPTAVYLLDLAGKLRLVAAGDVGVLLWALRGTQKDADYSRNRMVEAGDDLERDALVHLGDLIDQFRRHVLALHEKRKRPDGDPLADPPRHEETPS